MKEIPLTQGKFALVDDDDFERLNEFKWYFSHGYAVRIGPRPHRYKIYMHRVIINVPEGMEIDHIDGNGLNNLKPNLQIVTHRQNGQNRHNIRTSNFPGVSYINNTSQKRWMARIDILGKTKYLGCFQTEEEAHQRYESEIVKL